MRDYNEQEMEFLSRYERQLHSAYYSGWCSAISIDDAKRMWDIHNEARGFNERFNPHCQQCMYTLLKSIGELYFALKDKPVEKIEKKKTSKKK